MSPLELVATAVAVVLVAGITLAVFLLLKPPGTIRPALEQFRRRTGIDASLGLTAVAVFTLGLGSTFLLGSPPVGDSGELPFVGATAVFLVGLLHLALAVGNRDLYQRVVRTAATPALQVTDGPVLVSGTVEPADELVETPFTGSDVVCHTYSVEEYRRLLRRGAWSTTDYGEGGVPFYVRDDSGRVLVDPTGGRLELSVTNSATGTKASLSAGFLGFTNERVVSVESGEDLSERARTYHAANADERTTAPRDTRYKETVLEPGDPVTVVGTAGRVAGDYPSLPVVYDGAASPLVVAQGAAEDVATGLTKTVRRGGVLGGVTCVLGYLGMLLTAGVV